MTMISSATVWTLMFREASSTSSTPSSSDAAWRSTTDLPCGAPSHRLFGRNGVGSDAHVQPRHLAGELCFNDVAVHPNARGKDVEGEKTSTVTLRVFLGFVKSIREINLN